MKRATWCSLLVLFGATGCSRKFPQLQSPTLAVTVPPPAPAVRVVSTPRVTSLDHFFVQIAEASCGTDVDCGYQLKGGQYADWTDCGVGLSPRENGAGGLEAQDPACLATPATSGGLLFDFALNGNDTASGERNRLLVRTRTRAGLVSGEDSVDIVFDRVLPNGPTRAPSVSASAGQVNIEFGASPDSDVLGYLVYYGGAPASDGDFSRLDGSAAAEGTSPVFVPARLPGVDVSLALSRIPDGTPIYVGVTAVDKAYREQFSELDEVARTALEAKISARVEHESAKTFPADARRQFATPGEVSLRFIEEAASTSATLRARAVATHGDLVALVSVDTASANAPKTVVQLYSLSALTRGEKAPLNATPVVFDEKASASCGFPTALSDAPKHATFVDRYLFVSSGTGNVFALDVSTPSTPSKVIDGVASQTPGCAWGLHVQWPYLFIADGVSTPDPTPDSGDDTPGRVTIKRITRTTTLSYADVCPSEPYLASFDTALAVRWVNTQDQSIMRGKLIVQTKTQHMKVDITDDFVGCNYGGVGDPAFEVNALALQEELPLWVTARGPNSAQAGGRVSVGLLTTDTNLVSAAAFSTLELQQPVWSMASAGHFIALGEGKGRGVDILDVSDVALGRQFPRLAGAFPTVGDARDVVFAGPYLLVADSDTGLLVLSLAEPNVLVNLGAKATGSQVAVANTKSWISDLTKVGGNVRFFQQSLRSLQYTPIVAGGGGLTDYCKMQDVGAGLLACGATTDASPLVIKPCLSMVAQAKPTWASRCYPAGDATGGGGAPTTVRVVAMTGNELLFAHQPGGAAFRAVPIDGFAGGNVMYRASITDLTLGASSVIESAVLSHAPGLAAVATQAGTTIVDRKTSATKKSDVAGLRGATISTSELCGVRFASGAATLVCVSVEDPTNETLSVPLGTTTCNEASVDRAGALFAVGLLSTTAPTDTCEGLRIVDVSTASPRTASFAVDLTLPTVRLSGPYVYANCTLGMCQFGLRR